MRVDWKDPGDTDRLRELIAAETQAKQRDRFRVVLLTGAGLVDQKEWGREWIAAIVGRARQFVNQWVVRYRKQVLAGLGAIKQPGTHPRLSPKQQ